MQKLNPLFRRLCQVSSTLWLALLLSGLKSHLDASQSFRTLTHTPKRVALLLPLRGEWKAVSKAILSGFVTANTKAKYPLQITVIDTNNCNAQTSYQKAIQHKVDLVIGPLLKEDVKELSKHPSLPIPVLTLNYITSEAPANFYQFGLSPLHEIKQLVQQARAEQYRSAIVLAPDNAWGKNLAKACAREWERPGGLVADRLHYSRTMRTLSQQIRTLLQPAGSYKSSTQADCLFLIATSEVGRQINPLLTFYRTRPLPIYAPSSIYDESLPSHLNRDLDTIILCDTAWSLQYHHVHAALKEECSKANARHFTQYTRYYALGVDAFFLVMKLPILDQDSQKIIIGASGELYLNDDRLIIRKPPCAQFRRSTPYPLAEYEYKDSV